MKSLLYTWFLAVFFSQTTSGFLFMWNCTYSAECVWWAVILQDSFDLDILSPAWVMLEAHGVQLPGTCIPWQENPNQSCLHATWRKRREDTFFGGRVYPLKCWTYLFFWKITLGLVLWDLHVMYFGHIDSCPNPFQMPLPFLPSQLYVPFFIFD